MRPQGHVYHALIVSPGERFAEILKPLLNEVGCEKMDCVTSITSAKRCVLERDYDFVLINAPLPDDYGSKFAIDVSAQKTTVCLFVVKAEVYEEAQSDLSEQGVFVLAKPTSSSALSLAATWLVSARERLRGVAKKAVSIEDKMEEIRIVNRAKWCLIEQMHLTEHEAHRVIEKQAMDLCISKKEVAERVLKTYSEK